MRIFKNGNAGSQRVDQFRNSKSERARIFRELAVHSDNDNDSSSSQARHHEKSSGILRLEHLRQRPYDKSNRIIREVIDNSVLEDGGTIHLYLSLPNSAALANHTDITNIFVLQLYGSKDWLFCQEYDFSSTITMVNHLRGKLDQCTTYSAMEMEHLKCTRQTLHPGDALYLPKRVVHSARATPDGLSAHLTFGLSDHMCSEEPQQTRSSVRALADSAAATSSTCTVVEGGRSCNMGCEGSCNESCDEDSCDSNCDARCNESCDVCPSQKLLWWPTQSPTRSGLWWPTPLPSSATPTQTNLWWPTTKPPVTDRPSTLAPSKSTMLPSSTPSPSPSDYDYPSSSQTIPLQQPTVSPSVSPSSAPSSRSPKLQSTSTTAIATRPPSKRPTKSPSATPSNSPSQSPSEGPSAAPTIKPLFGGFIPRPSMSPSETPSAFPSIVPSHSPSSSPSARPSGTPTSTPSEAPAGSPSLAPTGSPSRTSPSVVPTFSPSITPTASPDSPLAQTTSSPSQWTEPTPNHNNPTIPPKKTTTGMAAAAMGDPCVVNDDCETGACHLLLDAIASTVRGICTCHKQTHAGCDHGMQCVDSSKAVATTPRCKVSNGYDCTQNSQCYSNHCFFVADVHRNIFDRNTPVGVCKQSLVLADIPVPTVAPTAGPSSLLGLLPATTTSSSSSKSAERKYATSSSSSHSGLGGCVVLSAFLVLGIVMS